MLLKFVVLSIALVRTGAFNLSRRKGNNSYEKCIKTTYNFRITSEMCKKSISWEIILNNQSHLNG